MKPTDFARHLTAFLTDYLAGQRQVSPHTIQAYRDVFVLFEKSRWVPHSLLWGGKRAARRAATISVWPTKQVLMPFMI
jgi:hypothetical protein